MMTHFTDTPDRTLPPTVAGYGDAVLARMVRFLVNEGVDPDNLTDLDIDRALIDATNRQSATIALDMDEMLRARMR